MLGDDSTGRTYSSRSAALNPPCLASLPGKNMQLLCTRPHHIPQARSSCSPASAPMAPSFTAIQPRLARPAVAGLAFYTHTLCPYAERVWLTLMEKVARTSTA